MQENEAPFMFETVFYGLNDEMERVVNGWLNAHPGIAIEHIEVVDEGTLGGGRACLKFIYRPAKDVIRKSSLQFKRLLSVVLTDEAKAVNAYLATLPKDVSIVGMRSFRLGPQEPCRFYLHLFVSIPRQDETP